MYYLKFSDFYFSQNKKYSTISSSGTIANVSDEILSTIPRNIKQRSFSFSPLQYLALNQISFNENFSALGNDRIGIYTGSETGGFQEYFKQAKRFYEKGLSRVSPYTIPRTIHNSGSAVLAIEKQYKGISGGFNGDESIGLVTLLDSILALDSNDQDVMIFGAGEQLPPINSTSFVDGAILGLISKNPLKNSFSFSLPFSLGRGKPWLSKKDNRTDLLNVAKESLGKLPEKIFLFHLSADEDDSFNEIILENYNKEIPDLKSLGPVLYLEYCLNSCNEFVYIVTSTDGFGIILVVSQS